VEREKFKYLQQWFIVMLLLLTIAITSVTVYLLLIIPSEAVIVNEIGDPLLVGDCWKQDDLFSLTVTGISEIDWDNVALDKYLATKDAKHVYQTERETGYRIYDICFSSTNMNYAGYTDRFEQGKPYKEGLWFGISIDGELNSEKKVKKITDSLIVPIKLGQTVDDKHIIVLAEPKIEEITLVFIVRQEDKIEKLADTAPDHIYRKMYRCYLPN